jgi:galactokinase
MHAPASDSSTPVSADGAEALLEAAARACRRCGGSPEILILAPGRVNLIGEHVDYNNGFVLPMAINRQVVFAGGPAADRAATLFSVAQDQTVRIPLDAPLSPGEPAWANYPRGVIAGFQQRGISVPGFAAVIEADLPLGGGLSSSAALEVATCRFIEALTGHSLAESDCIQLCQHAEHVFAGVPCGIMDQYIVTAARKDHALLLDCQSLEARHVPLASDEVAVIITHCGVAHELGKGEYARRRADCERAAQELGVPTLRAANSAQLEAAAPRLDPLALRRARHVIHEIDRTRQFAECLAGRDWATAGGLMYESHASLREDYEVSCAELDALVAIAEALGEPRGVYGARLTGAGFGGCTITLVRRGEAESVRDELVATYRANSGIAALSFISPPAAGARRIQSQSVVT